MTLRQQITKLKRIAILGSPNDRFQKVPKKQFSKVGGNPFLPRDFEWFRATSYDNHYLSFIAQFDLSEIHKYDKNNELPEMGFLYFFYDFEAEVTGGDPKNQECAKVFYFDGTKDELVETQVPDELSEDYRIPEMPIKIMKQNEFPKRDDLNAITMQDYDYDEIYEVLNKMDYYPLKYPIKLLGYADLMQGSMLTEVSMVADGINVNGFEHLEKLEKYQENALEWVLLFQVGILEDDDFYLEIGDEGKLYYFIRKEDLSNRRFDRVVAMTQCM